MHYRLFLLNKFDRFCKNFQELLRYFNKKKVRILNIKSILLFFYLVIIKSEPVFDGTIEFDVDSSLVKDTPPIKKEISRN
jgi:hypothetical protein